MPDTNRPLRIVLYGRTKKRLDGGLARSVRMIQEALRWAGNEVDLRSCNAPDERSLSGVDVVWHYGDPTLLLELYKDSQEAGVPFLVNSQFEGGRFQSGFVEHVIKYQAPEMFFVVFTDHARTALGELSYRAVVLPKTIRGHDDDSIPAKLTSRRGICIGELAKIRTPRLVDGVGLEDVVAVLKRAAPQEEVFTYAQYTTDEHEHVKGTMTLPKPREKMMAMLGSLKLFVALSSRETFYMVPAEAQLMGTPVVYPSMPQSHSEHLNSTAALYDNLDELEVVVRRLLSSPDVWHSYSKAGMRNAIAHNLVHTGYALDMALRRFVFGRPR